LYDLYRNFVLKLKLLQWPICLVPDGAGSKGTWGKPGDDMTLGAAIDSKDPNYDSDEEDGIVYQTTQ